jgi:hypothetical protein
MGIKGRNTWTYQEFKSMPHHERLRVCEASTDTVLSLIPYGCDVFLHILKNNSGYFHIYHSPIGLCDGNSVCTARNELRPCIYIYINK